MSMMLYGAVLFSIVVVLAAMPDGHAESPRAQFESGVPLGEIVCPDGKILLESPRGTPACARESSAELLAQRGFAVISQDETSPEFNGSRSFITVDVGIPLSETQNLVSNNNKFAVNFYKQVSDNDGNIFFSPIGVYMVFSALYEGAMSNTAEQIQQVFGLESDTDTRLNSTSRFMSHINQKDPYSILEMANALWISDAFTVYDSYTDPINFYYDAHIEVLDLLDVGEERIDKWAAKKTRNAIDDVIAPDDISGDTVMVITNAIYFAGEWKAQFPLDRTSTGLFWKNDQENVDVEIMRHTTHLYHAYLNETEILKLPYKGDRLSMLVILPNERNGIKSLEESITTESIKKWNAKLDFKKIEIQMPKFKMNTEYNLTKYLTELGMIDVFDADRANLLGIGGGDVYVSKATQKAFVDVDEVGTEAAAVTVVITDSVSGSESFTADHPFIFIIQDEETGAILFMGRLSDPLL